MVKKNISNKSFKNNFTKNSDIENVNELENDKIVSGEEEINLYNIYHKVLKEKFDNKPLKTLKFTNLS